MTHAAVASALTLSFKVRRLKRRTGAASNLAVMCTVF